MTTYQPDFLYSDGVFKAGALLHVDAAGNVTSSAEPKGQVIRLAGRALFPGLVNAHSHAFQRILRGRTERSHDGDDFWAWRELMYRAASTLNPQQLYEVSYFTFVEMALQGITTVGEFHYVHHQPNGEPYSDVHELSKAVVQAARDAGLRIVLLRVGYARAGFQVAPNSRQARFLDPDIGTYLSRSLDLKFLDPLVTVGLAPHSVRAVPKSWLSAIAQVNGLPVHIHVAEQPAEIEACRAEHGKHPVDLLDEVGLLHAAAVHAIHLEESHFRKLKRVVACPSTEANLGDGVIRADELLKTGVRIALGSDSQARISLLDEARLLDENLRLLRQRRAVLDDGKGRLAQTLFDCASRAGAELLGLNVGTLEVGEPADFFTLPVDSLAEAVFGQESVCDVAVQGKMIVRDGQHAGLERAKAGFKKVVAEALS